MDFFVVVTSLLFEVNYKFMNQGYKFVFFFLSQDEDIL